MTPPAASPPSSPQPDRDLPWPSLRWRRVLFWFYAAVLFTATHWPNLQIEVPGVERPDLFLHLGAFSTWTALLWAAGYAGPRSRWKTLLWLVPIAVAYAGIDESSQGLPGVHRTVALDDFLANCTGVSLGTLAAAIATALVRKWGLPHP